MKRVHHPFTKWEEIPYNMYQIDFDGEAKQDLINEAVYLLSTPNVLQTYMKRTTIEWPNSTEHHMTNSSRNKQAWLGQAACALFAKIPEDCTKQAWSMLSDEQRQAANLVADGIIKDWKER